MQYRNFICYRGGKSPGKSIAGKLFDILDKRREELGATYFSPRGEAGKAARNYIRDIDCLRTAKNVILILTSDYFDDFLTDDCEPNLDSVAVQEFYAIADVLGAGASIGIVPVFWDFSWRDENAKFGFSNKEIVEYIWGDDAQSGGRAFTAALGNGGAFEPDSRVRGGDGRDPENIPDGIVEYVVEAIRAGFPMSYVRQGSHTIYLPTLLDVTPFEFTYIVLSDKGEGCASELNFHMLAGGRSWEEADWRTFLSGVSSELNEVEALVVNVPECEAGCIRDILGVREERMPSTPMLVNVYGDSSIATQDAIPAEVLECGHAGMLLTQVDVIAEVPRLSDGEIRVLHRTDLSACWRRLIGHRGYRELASELRKRASSADLYLLSTEDTRENFRYYGAEKMNIRADAVMLEQKDSNSEFVARVYDWEKGVSR